VTSMLPSEEIRATKALLMEEGWVQGSYARHGDGNRLVGRCILGALGYVQFGRSCHFSYQDQYYGPNAAFHILVETCGNVTFTRSVASYNDAVGRTFNEICDLLDKAEKLALIREEEQ
jgi:hypothetical protein